MCNEYTSCDINNQDARKNNFDHFVSFNLLLMRLKIISSIGDSLSLPNPRQNAIIEVVYGPARLGTQPMTNDVSAHDNTRLTTIPTIINHAVSQKPSRFVDVSATIDPANAANMTMQTSAPTGPNAIIKSESKPVVAAAEVVPEIGSMIIPYVTSIYSTSPKITNCTKHVLQFTPH